MKSIMVLMMLVVLVAPVASGGDVNISRGGFEHPFLPPALFAEDRPARQTHSGQDCGLYYGVLWGYPMDGIGQRIQITGEGVSKVLETVVSPSKREVLAKEWLQVFEQTCRKNWEFQEKWLQLQAQYLQFQREIEQLRVEKLRLAAEIEKLQVEKLRLEKEKLELQKKINK